MSAGVHRLLRRGATVVTSAAEVIEAVGELGVDLAPEQGGPVGPRDALDHDARRVLDAVPARHPATLDAVARTAGLAPSTTASALGLLDIAGLVRSVPDGWVLVRPRTTG